MKRIILLIFIIVNSIHSNGQGTVFSYDIRFIKSITLDSCLAIRRDSDTLKLGVWNDKAQIWCDGCDSLIFSPSKTNLPFVSLTDLAGKENANVNIQAHIISVSNPHSVTKSQVGLSNVNNTTDLNKPVSTATQTALNLKENTISAGIISQYYRGDKTFQTLDKSSVGLSNVDNTVDSIKPISTATQTALNLKESTITAGTIAQYYRGDKSFQTLDKSAVGLSLAENTSDLNKVVSTLTQTALNGKASTSHAATHITGGSDIIPNAVAAGNAGLMIGTDKTKLDGIAAGATVNATDAALRARSSHTGTQTASTISDFDAAVTANASVVANTAKVTNATHTGDATGATALTVVKINGTLLSGLATGILKNTTVTGVPSIALAGTDYLIPSGSAALLTSFPTLNQNTTGTAGGLSANIVESQVSNLVSDLASKVSTSTLKQGAYLSDTTKFPLTTSLRQGAYLSDTTKFAPSTGIANSALANTSVANLSGTNTGDNAINSLYSGLISNATHIGDATGSTALTVVKINGTLLSGLATGLLKNTTTTGVPSIAIGSDIPNISESQVTNLVTDLSAKAPIASPTFTGTVTLPASQVVNGVTLSNAGLATNFLNATGSYIATPSSDFASYRTIINVNGSHIAAKVAGTYAMADGDPIAITGGTGTLYPLSVVYLTASDFPTVNGLSAKLRIRAELFVNDIAPTGNYTFGLYPITRPAISGAPGLNIYTLGTVVTGSNGATFTAPAADGLLFSTGVDFAMPADGFYVIGIVTTALVAVGSHVHLSAQLQTRYN